MPTREILESHSAATLKKEISKTNIKGYSKMKKAELVDLMLKHKDRFHHIKMAEKKTKKTITKKDPAVQKKAKEFSAAIAQGSKVAEKVRKTAGVKPDTQGQEALTMISEAVKKSDMSKRVRKTAEKLDFDDDIIKVRKKTTKSGEVVLVEEPVKNGSVVYDMKEGDEIGTWDADNNIVIPLKSSSAKPASAPMSSFGLETISSGKPVSAEQKTEAVGIAQQMTGMSKKELNKLDPLALFGMLPVNVRKQILDPKQTGVKVGSAIEEAFSFMKNRMDKLLEGTNFKRTSETEFKQQVVAWILRGMTETRRDADDRRLLRGANILNPNTSRINKTFVNIMSKAIEEPKKNVKDPVKYVIDLWANKQKNPDRVRMLLEELLNIKVKEKIYELKQMPIVDKIQPVNKILKQTQQNQGILGVKGEKYIIGNRNFKSDSIFSILEYFQKMRELNKDVKMKISMGSPSFSLDGEKVKLNDDKTKIIPGVLNYIGL